MSVADLRREVASAAKDAVAGTEPGTEGTAQAEAPAPVGATSAASAEGGPVVEPEAASRDAEASDGTADARTEYFGFDLSDFEPNQRIEIIEELKKRDDHIGKLLRGKVADEEETPAPAPAPLQQASDEDILQALGLDPDNPFDEQAAKVAVPLVRKQLEQEAMLSQLIEMQELNEIDRSWRGTLGDLEKEFGVLPTELDHEAVMEYAANNGINSPVAAYWQIMGPGRAALAEATKGDRAKKLTDAKRASASTRPAPALADDDAPLESKTTKGATREAAQRIMRELGLGE